MVLLAISILRRPGSILHLLTELLLKRVNILRLLHRRVSILHRLMERLLKRVNILRLLRRLVSIRLMGPVWSISSTVSAAAPYVAQKGGDAVVVPAGRESAGSYQSGDEQQECCARDVFDGVVLNDVIAGGFKIAIPRGASFQGNVVDAHTAGQLGGKGELKLQLTSISFGGMVYPVATDFWWHQGADKTANTVGNTVGLASVGALIGAVAGGGVGAAVGAGVGGVAGLGVSSASGM